MIQLGLRLHDAGKKPLAELLKTVRGQGFTCGHLALSKLLKDLPLSPESLTPGYAAYLKHIFADAGIDIAVLGNYLNLADPDAERLERNKEMYYAHLRFASLLGCGMVGTETGAPNSEYKTCDECRSEEALATFIENLRPVVKCAEHFGVILAIEPVIRHIVYNAKRARQVLDEISSPNLQILFDPVNLLDADNAGRRDEIFEEFTDLLGKDICMLHLKDFVYTGSKDLKSVGAGTGEMDYTAILRYMKEKKPFIFATLENTTPENASNCREYIQMIYDSLG